MFYVKVPVTNGNPDINWANPPIDSFQLTETERYCIFSTGIEVRSSWQAITEEQYNQAKPIIPEIVIPDTTTLLGQYIVQQTLKNAELEQKIDAVGQGVVQLMLK